MIEYIDLKIDFTSRNARVGGVTLDGVTTRNYDTAIRFRIEIIGHVLDDAYDVKILTKYHKSGLRVMTTLGESLEIVDGKIIYTPKVNLIIEADYIRNFLYLSKDGLGLDMAQFNYRVDVSQIGEVAVEVKQVYDESYETLLAEFEQALEDYKLTLPQADSVRAEIDVVLNQFGMDSQNAIGDLGEVSAAVEIAEASRVEKESERDQAETERKEAETLREDNYEQLIDTALIEADVVEKVDNKVTELTPRMNELTARINNLIANAGDTDDNAELLDIRVGFDGITYATAGEAVRSLGNLILQGKQIFKLNNEVFDSGLRLGTEALRPLTTSVYEVSDGRLKVTSSGTRDHIGFEFQERFQEDDVGDLFYASIKYELKNPVNEFRLRLIDQQIRLRDDLSLSLKQTHTLSVYERYERSNEMLTRPYGYTRYGSIEEAAGSSYYISKPLLLNLTKIFGEGNEPTEKEIKDILSSMPDSWFEGERSFVKNIKNDTTEGGDSGNEDGGQSHTKASYDDIKVDRVRDTGLDTTYFLTWINNETFSGGKIVPKIKITASNAESRNIRWVKQFISDEGSEGREYEVVINAGIQMPNNVADGLIISEGEILRDEPQETHLNQYALGINDEGNLKAFPHTVSAQDILSDGYTNAVVAFVPLIENGEKVDQSIIEICPHWSQPNPRQVIGQFDNGDYIIMTVNGRLPSERGMTLPEMADILMNLGVHFAYNLDGGGSTQTFIKKKRINQDYNRTRPTLMTFERIN